MTILFDYQNIYNSYSDFENKDFVDRYLSFKKLDSKLRSFYFNRFKNSIIGYSFNQLPIYAIQYGYGPIKILIWSQMHGNETTSTKSILDFLSFILQFKHTDSMQQLQAKVSLSIIPMLNPDGATTYSRLNANDVDLNRDAIAKSQVETKIFFNHLEAFQPNYCINMHGQRSIFAAGNTDNCASLSFLAPSYNEEMQVNITREKSMQLISSVYHMLQHFIPKSIGRYDETFNRNCFGDYIQHQGISTILFEAGHYPGDYHRNTTRKYVFLSLLKTFESIILLENNILQNKNLYYYIPMNSKIFLDCIIKNVKNTKSGYIGVMYKENLNGNRVDFKPFISNLGDLSKYYAHKYVDAKQKEVCINDTYTINFSDDIQNIKIGQKTVLL